MSSLKKFEGRFAKTFPPTTEFANNCVRKFRVGKLFKKMGKEMKWESKLSAGHSS